jgi:hypothetical protein
MSDEPLRYGVDYHLGDTHRCSPNCIAEPQPLMDLLNAAHDITCKGCGWCDYTGEAVMRALTDGAE